MLPLNYVVLVGATVMTKKSWDALSPANREAMRKIAAEAGKQMQIRSREENNMAIEAMKKRGLQVHPLSPELETEWRQFLEAVYPKMRGTMVPGDVFDEVQQILKEYRTGPQAGR
jgi:TRAP-type C4-dicarboxylate transport system substrate-binding protein